MYQDSHSYDSKVLRSIKIKNVTRVSILIVHKEIKSKNFPKLKIHPKFFIRFLEINLRKEGNSS